MTNQIGGALPAQVPGGLTGKSDKQIAKVTAKKLTAAIKATKDPQLAAAFSSTLAGLHTYLAQDSKELKANQAGKVNSKAVREAKPVKSRKA